MLLKRSLSESGRFGDKFFPEVNFLVDPTRSLGLEGRLPLRLRRCDQSLPIVRIGSLVRVILRVSRVVGSIWHLGIRACSRTSDHLFVWMFDSGRLPSIPTMVLDKSVTPQMLIAVSGEILLQIIICPPEGATHDTT